MRHRWRATVALAGTVLTSAAVVGVLATPAQAGTRLEAESSTYGGACGDGAAQHTYTAGDGSTVLFNGGDYCTMTFNAPGQTAVEQIRWFGGGAAGDICGDFVVKQGGVEKARSTSATRCSVSNGWRITTFPAHTLSAGSFDVVWDADQWWQDAHVDYIEIASSTTRREAESSTYGGACGDGPAQYTYTTGDATVLFNGGDNCTMTFSNSSTTSVQRIRWFGGGVAGDICGDFIVKQGGVEKARSTSTTRCSVNNGWQITTFTAHTLASGPFDVVWDADQWWHDAHVDYIETGGGTTPPPCGNPAAGLTPVTQTGVAPYTASFSPTATAASGCSITNYVLSFGDSTGEAGTTPTPTTHSYPSPGTYTPTLTVTQSDGKTASVSATVTVNGPVASNDNFASALVGSGAPYRHVVSTVYSTVQSGEPRPCAGIGSTLWYRWTSPVTQTVEAELYGSNYDTALAVYSGTSLSSLTQIGCNDGFDTTGGPSAQVSWTASPGVTYYVQVGGRNGASGTADFDIKAFTGPVNDNFENATSLTSTPVFRNDVTTFASSQVGEPNTCNGGGTSVWYRYTHPSTRPARRIYANTFSTSWNTVLSVFSGSALNSLSPVTCNDNARGTNQSQVSWIASPGASYYLRASGVGNATGNLTLRVQEGALLSMGDSVVAGHGIGSNPNGYPNNPAGTYSQLAGNDLALNVYNLARSGSCAHNNDFAGSTEPRRFLPDSCDALSIHEQQLYSWASAMPGIPTHVVIGVGANDIEFASCLEGYMAWDGVTADGNKEKMDRCTGTTLANRLSAVSTSVQSIIDSFGTNSALRPYIQVMGYFNPFSDAPSDANQVCDMWIPVAIARNHNLATQDHETFAFRSAVVPYQRDGYAFANQVVTSLNDTLRSVAQSKGATFVETAPTFVNHDMCRTLRDDVVLGAGNGNPSNTWVFGPDFTDEFDHPFMWPRRYESRRMPADCQFPQAGDAERHITPDDWREGPIYDYDMWFRPNCMPHPTASGHVALAGILKPFLPTG